MAILFVPMDRRDLAETSTLCSVRPVLQNVHKTLCLLGTLNRTGINV